MKAYLMYIGRTLSSDNKILFAYRVLESLDFNYKTESSDLKNWLSKVKMFKGNIGSIYEVNFKDDSKVSYNPKALPVAYWQNPIDRARWEAEQAPVEQLEALKKDGLENKINEVLKPLKILYINSTRRERQAIIAKILNEITQ